MGAFNMGRGPLILAHNNARNAVWFATHFTTRSVRFANNLVTSSRYCQKSS